MVVVAWQRPVMPMVVDIQKMPKYKNKLINNTLTNKDFQTGILSLALI